MPIWNSTFGLATNSIEKCFSIVYTQVRTATKKAAGSRTSMKDSAGRRLGPKKYEGQLVKPGEILMRQRGTKFFPGENVGIGKDHSIFAVEPGFVRYYLDPFHPKRKFIGVALAEHLRLPTPHFAPRVRRFGRQVINNPEMAQKEANSLTRKQYLARDSIVSDMATRNTRRSALRLQFAKFLTETLQVDLVGSSMDRATEYLLRVRSSLKNGASLSDAQFNSQHYLEQEILLQAKREDWTQDALEHDMRELLETTRKVDTIISFNNRLELIGHISSEERATLKANLLDSLSKATLFSKKDKEAMEKLFESSSKFLTRSEEVHLRRKFLKPVKPEGESMASENEKKFISLKRFNHVRGGIDIVSRSRTAFLNKL
ncbi:LADA_0H15984g1_1 [Lachancea dasiensis]|uniref:Large ribosomal subunit protein bL27m n=1 Tax=Lachancea dasiensis TaxID=1072105 RepID=A0A1G4K530_9SACH|nr:LADA_0H15984g1_1 [Lachancea dasiensis]